LSAGYLMVTVCVCSLNKRNGRTHGRRNKCFDTHLTEMASCKSIRPGANRILSSPIEKLFSRTCSEENLDIKGIDGIDVDRRNNQVS
jgi:hypothetical protein